MNTAVVDCQGINSEKAFWDHYVSILKPQGAEFFGRNLDAFWDAIDGGGPGFPEQEAIRFINTQDLKAIRGGVFYEALCKLAKESRFDGITFE